jgi:hypothetical protein
MRILPIDAEEKAARFIKRGLRAQLDFVEAACKGRLRRTARGAAHSIQEEAD